MTNITLGILGGGQLGRMSAQAAAKLSIKTITYAPEDSACPAGQLSDAHVQGAYDDQNKLSEFAAKCDFISYEFENIPVETVAYLRTLKPVYPDERLLEISQDRVAEKSYLNSIGIETAPWAEVNSAEDIKSVFQQWNTSELILKTTRFGYDGKGQYRAAASDNFDQVFSDLGNAPLIAEGIINFECEISVIIARDHSGKMIHYGPMLNEHKNHILHKTTCPSGIDEALEKRAIDMGYTLAEKIDLRGVLTLELFVTKDGSILANEIAPRTHNSGHYSIDACAHSQFENHVRAVCGLSVLDPAQHSKAEMINLIGDDVMAIKNAPDNVYQRVHLYGKKDIKPGRKMGHVTKLSSSI